MGRLTSMIAALGLAVAAGPALAHDDATLDMQKAPNGGQLRMAGAYHLELVLAKNAQETQDSPVVVYVTDHAGGRVATAGATGSATLLSGKTKSVATLQPDGDNRLKGTAKYSAGPGIKAVVSVTLAGKAAEQARFAPMGAGDTGHKH